MKKIIIFLSLVIFLFIGISAVVYAARAIPLTYDGRGTDVTELMESYQDKQAAGESGESGRSLPEEPDGIASIIVATDLSETEAVNNVASIVFDYRGYDTMGESFILLTAIAGSFIILKNVKGRKEENGDDDQ